MRWVEIAVTLSWILAVAGCGDGDRASAPAERPANVVLVLVDTLRADRLSSYGATRATSPHIDALAGDGTRFTNASSTASWTLPAMASLFTSLYPSVHEASKASRPGAASADPDFRPSSALHPSRTTLAEVLSAQGIRTAAWVDGEYPGPHFGLDQGFEEFVAGETDGLRLNTEALFAWLDREEPQRFFAYVHAMEVHSPYMPPSAPRAPDARLEAEVLAAFDDEAARYRAFPFEVAGYDGPIEASWRSWIELQKRATPLSPPEIEALLSVYDRGVAYADYWVGEIVRGLRERGLYEETIVIVTSDHGDELFDHGTLGHGTTYYEEVLHIPLVIRVPGLGAGAVVDTPVGLIDLTPTVLDLLEIEHDLELQGQSLRPLLAGGTLAERALFAEASIGKGGSSAIRRGHDKLIARGPRRPVELYDLQADPDETHDRCAAEPALCKALRRELRGFRAEMTATRERLSLPPGAPVEVDPATRERLRILGYTE